MCSDIERERQIGREIKREISVIVVLHWALWILFVLMSSLCSPMMSYYCFVPTRNIPIQQLRL